MNSIKITTSQNIDLEYDLASVGERILAWLLDVALFAAYFIVVSLIINTITNFNNFFNDNPWIAVFLGVPFIFYNLVCDIWLNGQTVGKKVLKIKVISLNGEQASIGQYMIRWLFRIVDIYLLDALPAFICVIVSEKKQRIGDIVAGTAVIKTVPRSSLQQTIYVPTPEVNYTISFPEVANLSDRDMQLIKEVIINVNKTGNSVLAYQAAEKIKNTLHITTNLEPLYFLQVLLADYNHITSKM